MTPPIVYAGYFSAYDPALLRDFVAKGLDPLLSGLRGSRVLLKPNLVIGKGPERAVNTHPAVVRAVTEVLLDGGAVVSIGDSPGYESTERSLRKALIWPLVERYGLTVAHFTGRIEKTWKGISPYRRFVLGEDPDAYSLIINLPKLKTHAMMGLTLGVKNIFGFVPGLEKARWHLRAGTDRRLFAALLIDLYNLVNPALTILDGITGMDGDGPTNGRRRSIGLMAMAQSAFSLDRVVEMLLGLPSPTPVTAVAMEEGLVGRYEVVREGDGILPSLRLPGIVGTDWGLPGMVKGALTRAFVRRPRVKAAHCEGCGICAEVCSPGAISAADGTPSFDYSRCIRCYCCQEMCPQGAIKLK